MNPRDKHRAPSSKGESAINEANDSALFRTAVGPVRELQSASPPPRKPRPAPATRMADLDDAQARSEFQRTLDATPLLAGDPLSYRRHEAPPHVLRRLARGHYATQDEIDLHHLDSAQATAVLRQFLNEARNLGLGCVRVIHGKGLRADDGVPVLKNLVDRLLRQRSDILAFHSAPATLGGTGAVLVLLSRR